MSAIQRVTEGKFAPGKSANPSGRPKGWAGIAKAIRAQTNDGQDLIDVAVKVLRDEAEETRDRLAALAWLSDRGWGKAMQSVELSVDQGTGQQYDFSKLSVDEQRELLAKLDAIPMLEGSEL